MRARWLSAAGIMVAGSLALAGCGTMPEEAVDKEEIVLASPDAAEDTSPATGATPEVDAIEVEATTAVIKDGKLDPADIEAPTGEPFVLTVTGDGTEHTFEIKDTVDPMKIAADGPTNVEFVAPENPGEFEILIDGKAAGTFRSVSPDGAS